MKPKNFDKTCRVCLDVSDFVTPIFGTVFKSDLPDKITFCTGLKIKSGDGNPNQICQCCLDNLHISYIFKKTCVKNNNFFLKHFYGIQYQARVKLEKISTDIISKNVVKVENFFKEKGSTCDKHDEISHVKNEIEVEVSNETIENFDDYDYGFHTYNENSQNIAEDDKNDKKLTHNDKASQKNETATEITNDESIIILAKDDSDDDFYWHEDEDLMRVLEKSAIPAKAEDVNRIKSIEKATKVSKANKNEASKNVTRTKWQRLDNDGNPKKTKKQLQKEAAEARRQKLEQLQATKPKPKTNKVKILPDGALPKVKKKRIRNKPPNRRCCLVCDLVFPTREKRDAHVHEVHGGFTSSFICEVCGTLIKNQSSYNYHYRSHYPPQFSCKHPGCTFKAFIGTVLRKHMLVHEVGEEGMFRYPCAQCDAKYKSASARKAHVDRVHCARVRRHACAICGKAYYEKPKLRRHLMTHTNERPHACNICEAKYIRRHQLRVHLQNAHGVTLPRATPGLKRNRIVDIHKLKDAGKLVVLDKHDEVGMRSEKVGMSSENLGMRSEKDGISSEKVGISSEKVGMSSEKVGMSSEKVGMRSEKVGIRSEKVGIIRENVNKQDKEIAMNNILQEGIGYEITIGDDVYGNDIIVEYTDDVIVMDMPKL